MARPLSLAEEWAGDIEGFPRIAFHTVSFFVIRDAGLPHRPESGTRHDVLDP